MALTFDQPDQRRGGRPVEDRVARRQQAFRAVAPLIIELGVARISMARAARAASMSVGGLYHYFGGKRELLLYGLAPENLERLCADFRARYDLASVDPKQLLRDSLRELVSAAEVYVRPSLAAAGQLGVATVREQLDAALAAEVVGLVSTVRSAYPFLSVSAGHRLDRTLRRTCALSLLDPTVTSAELHRLLVAAVDAEVRAAVRAGEGG